MEKLEKLVKITRQGLVNLLMDFRKNVTQTGVAFGNVVYHVDESGSRQMDGQKALQKITRVNITIGSNYEGRVNRDLTKQGEEANFTAQPMSGKEYVNEQGVLATDSKTKTKNYLVAIVENSAIPKTIYFHKGKRIEKAEAIEKDLFAPSYFKDEKTAGRGNVSEEKNFHVINPSVDNILSITLNKVKYIVED
jgi:hypothetical protein